MKRDGGLACQEKLQLPLSSCLFIKVDNKRKGFVSQKYHHAVAVPTHPEQTAHAPDLAEDTEPNLNKFKFQARDHQKDARSTITLHLKRLHQPQVLDATILGSSTHGHRAILAGHDTSVERDDRLSHTNSKTQKSNVGKWQSRCMHFPFHDPTTASHATQTLNHCLLAM